MKPTTISWKTKTFDRMLELHVTCFQQQNFTLQQIRSASQAIQPWPGMGWIQRTLPPTSGCRHLQIKNNVSEDVANETCMQKELLCCWKRWNMDGSCGWNFSSEHVSSASHLAQVTGTSVVRADSWSTSVAWLQHATANGGSVWQCGDLNRHEPITSDSKAFLRGCLQVRFTTPLSRRSNECSVLVFPVFESSSCTTSGEQICWFGSSRSWLCSVNRLHISSLSSGDVLSWIRRFVVEHDFGVQ